VQENEELRRQLQELYQLFIRREDEVETLADHADRLQLEDSCFVRLLRIYSRHERHISTGTHRLPTRDERHSGETLKWLLMHVAMLQGYRSRCVIVQRPRIMPNCRMVYASRSRS
jgi:hypothetical protein